MKVLQITNNYPTAKSPIFGIFVKEQIESLNNLGIETELFFIDGFGKGKIEYAKAIFRLFHKLLWNRYDIVHCHHALSGLVYALTFKFRHIPCVISYQTDPVNEFGMKLFDFLKRKFDVCIFKNNSPLILNLRHGYYLPNGINIDFFKPIDKNECKRLLGLDNNKRYVLFVSSFIIRPEKREDRFDEVVAIMQHEYPEMNFTPLKLINVTRDKMPLYFNSADIYVMTSEFEGSPNAVKESICCNTPVVTTDVGNVRDMIGDIEGCYICEPYNAAEMARMSYEICVSKTPFSGREVFLQKGYEMAATAQKIISIYRSLMQLTFNQ